MIVSPQQRALAERIVKEDPFWLSIKLYKRPSIQMKTIQTCWKIEEPNVNQKIELAQQCNADINYINGVPFVRATNTAYCTYMIAMWDAINLMQTKSK